MQATEESDADDAYVVWGRLRLPFNLDEGEAREVLRQHEGLLRIYLRRYPIPLTSLAFTHEDAYAVGQSVLLQAHATYDPASGATFATWAGRLLSQTFSDIARRVRLQTRPEQRAVMRARAGEHLSPREASAAARAEARYVLSLSRTRGRGDRIWHAGEGTAVDTPLEEDLPASTECTPETEAAHNEDLAWLRQRLANGLLSDQEKTVVQFQLHGRSRQEAAEHLRVSRQRVDAIHQTALTKLRAAAVRDRRV